MEAAVPFEPVQPANVYPAFVGLLSVKLPDSIVYEVGFAFSNVAPSVPEYVIV